MHDLDGVTGFTFKSIRHAKGIIETDFPEVVTNLCNSLEKFDVRKEDIVSSGGGLSPIVQGFSRTLKENGWHEKSFLYEARINDEISERFKFSSDFFYLNKGSLPGISLVIEWNNKDPFYDRDLEHFRQMHKFGIISAGILITRGESLQSQLLSVFREFLGNNDDALEGEIVKLKGLSERVRKKPNNKLNIVAKALFNSKFGQATTHWDKLIKRVNNKVGDPCPLLVVGIEKERLV
jgi:hypothetical protein